MSLDSLGRQRDGLDAEATILVTGAGGFIGKALCNFLASETQARVIGLVRNECSSLDTRIRQVPIDLAAAKLPVGLLSGVSHVIHLAAIVHDKNKAGFDPNSNSKMVERILDAVADSNVKRFIYMSSVGVYGAGGGSRDAPLVENQEPSPTTSYGLDKLAGEALVAKRLGQEKVSWTVIRAPLVYGLGAKGSFGQLLHLVKSGLPIPFGSLTNSRTMVSLSNLISLLERSLWHSAAHHQILHACDNETLQVDETVRVLEQCVGRKLSRVIVCPPRVLRVLGLLSRRSVAIEQMMLPLWLSNEKAKTLLGWEPVETVFDGLSRSFSYSSCAIESEPA